MGLSISSERHSGGTADTKLNRRKSMTATNNQTEAVEGNSSPTTGPASSECGCWAETDQGLAPQGYQVSSALSYLRVKNGAARVARCLPLERLDGKRMKRGEPRSIEMTFCPWCGKQYPQNSEV